MVSYNDVNNSREIAAKRQALAEQEAIKQQQMQQLAMQQQQAQQQQQGLPMFGQSNPALQAYLHGQANIHAGNGNIPAMGLGQPIPEEIRQRVLQEEALKQQAAEEMAMQQQGQQGQEQAMLEQQAQQAQQAPVDPRQQMTPAMMARG